MKKYLTVCAICLLLKLTGFAQPNQPNLSDTLLSDTGDVCIPVEVARKAAIDLERYDGLKLQFPVLESIISAQKTEVSIMQRQRDSALSDLNDSQSVLSTQIGLTTMWQELSGTHKKQRNIAFILAGVLFVGLVAK